MTVGQGRDEEAVAVLSPFAASGHRNETGILAELLVRHDRTEEAIEVLHPVAMADPECLLDMLCVLLIKAGRIEEADAAVNQILMRHGLDPFGVRMSWIEPLVECGYLERAIVELRKDPDVDTGYVRVRLAELLTEAGRPDEAITVLRPARDQRERATLALALIRRGQAEQAIEAMHSRPPARTER